jgi:1,4-dihydroxy-2-naphthoate octaprenyltransferase
VVVRLGPELARWGYGLIAVLAHGWVLAMVLAGHLPALGLLALLSAVASFAASRVLWRHAATPAQLAPAIKLTILAAVLYGLLLAAGLVIA